MADEFKSLPENSQKKLSKEIEEKTAEDFEKQFNKEKKVTQFRSYSFYIFVIIVFVVVLILIILLYRIYFTING